MCRGENAVARRCWRREVEEEMVMVMVVVVVVVEVVTGVSCASAGKRQA